MGEPNATDIPAAAAADRTSRFRAARGQKWQQNRNVEKGGPSLSFILPNSFMKRFAQQHATCTRGPSFPSHIPDATARHCDCQNQPKKASLNPLTRPSDFIANVQVPIKRRITKPPRTVLISGIPLCFAYKANSFTKILAEIANSTWNRIRKS